MEHQSFDPELRLEGVELAHLSVLAAMPGYRVLHRILRSEVDKFIISLINADGSDDAEILARHRLAKAASQFYQGATDRINEIIMHYRSAAAVDMKPVDVTENVLDLGDIERTAQQLPNLFEEGDYLNEHN